MYVLRSVQLQKEQRPEKMLWCALGGQCVQTRVPDGRTYFRGDAKTGVEASQKNGWGSVASPTLHIRGRKQESLDETRACGVIEREHSFVVFKLIAESG